MRDTYFKLLDLLDRREKRNLALLLVMVLFMGALEAAGVGSIMPFLSILTRPELVESNEMLGRLYEMGGFEDPEQFMVALGTGVAFLVVFSLLFKALTLYAIIRFTQMRSFSLGSRMLAGYLGQPYSWYLNRHSAELSRSVLGEVNQVVSGTLMPALRLIAFAVVAICLLGVVVIMDPWIALVAGLVVAVAYGSVFLVARGLLARIGAERVEANRERFKIVQEATGGIKDAKVLEIESVLARRFTGPARRVAHCQTLNQVIGETPRYVLEAVLYGGMLLLVVYLMLSRPGGVMEIVPLIGVYAFAGVRLMPAMQQIYQMLTRMRFGKPALDTLHRDLMEIRSQGRGVPGPAPEPMGLERALELKGVRYAYPNAERAALEGLDMTIRARSTVGIVGGTGAGKTTAVDVILGLLDPDAGGMEVDGVPVTGERMRAWRRSIGYVPQHIFLADDTVAANIAFGLPGREIDMEAVERAARIAELHDFVLRELPEGYRTKVGERGVRLSGGQRQRIGIARALYRDPDVLLLDEATSALDNLTERAVMEAVGNLGDSKTIIMVAHRLSTVRDCETIFLMERGQVAAQGSFAELLETSETFRKLAQGTEAPTSQAAE